MNSIQAFLDHHRAAIALAIVVVTFVGFLLERFPPSVIAMTGAGLFLALGLISTDEALAAFSNSAPITIAAMFVLSGALIRTGAIEAVASRILVLAKVRPRLACASLFVGAFVASAFVNNTPVVLVLIPIITQLAAALKLSPQRLLIPLSFTAVMGGACTLIGTSTNLLVDGIARELGQPGFGVFEVTGVGLAAAAAGGLFLLLFGPLLLPRGRAAGNEGPEPLFLTELRVRPGSSLLGDPLGQAKPLSPRGVKVIALYRKGSPAPVEERDEALLEERDRILVRATLSEMLTLAAGKDFEVGVTRRERPADAEDEIVEVGVAAGHPGIGRPIADVPFLSNHPVRLLGVTRHRHHPGPNLRSARLKAGDRLLVKGGLESFEAMRANTALIFAGALAAHAFRRDRLAIAIAAIAGVVLLATWGVMPIAGLALIGVAAILVLRCIDAEEAWTSLEGNVLVLIFSMLMMGTGLQETGAVQLIVDAAGPLLRDASPFWLLIGVYGLTSTLTEAVTNSAVAVLMTPIVLSLAEGIGIDARPLIVAVMFGASASFATPVGYQTNTLVYTAGNYRFVDFVKIGLPMNVIVGLASCAAIHYFMGAGTP